MTAQTERVYLDHANGTALRPEVIRAMQRAMSWIGNPSSLHAEGRAAGRGIDRSRAELAALIGAQSEEIFFTSSGTEANSWALLGLTNATATKGRHLVVSSIEHLSILQTAKRLEREGWKVTWIPVGGTGRIDPDALERALTPETVLVSVQWANGEVGTLQPMEELVRRVKSKGILFHSDAVAAAGQVPIDVRKVSVDLLSLAANTFGGPPGVGALFVRKGVRIVPLFIGGAQEEGRRAGAENGLGIVGMGEAAALARQELPRWDSQLIPLRDRLIQGILERIPETSLNGDPMHRLPGHVSVSFPGVDAEALALALDLNGAAVGLGSACPAKTMKASHVLKAMGIEESRALGTITCTLGIQTSEEELQRFLDLLPRVVAQQRSVQLLREGLNG